MCLLIKKKWPRQQLQDQHYLCICTYIHSTVTCIDVQVQCVTDGVLTMTSVHNLSSLLSVRKEISVVQTQAYGFNGLHKDFGSYCLKGQSCKILTSVFYERAPAPFPWFPHYEIFAYNYNFNEVFAVEFQRELRRVNAKAHSRDRNRRQLTAKCQFSGGVSTCKKMRWHCCENSRIVWNAADQTLPVTEYSKIANWI